MVLESTVSAGVEYLFIGGSEVLATGSSSKKNSRMTSPFGTHFAFNWSFRELELTGAVVEILIRRPMFLFPSSSSLAADKFALSCLGLISDLIKEKQAVVILSSGPSGGVGTYTSS